MKMGDLHQTRNVGGFLAGQVLHKMGLRGFVTGWLRERGFWFLWPPRGRAGWGQETQRWKPRGFVLQPFLYPPSQVPRRSSLFRWRQMTPLVKGVAYIRNGMEVWGTLLLALNSICMWLCVSLVYTGPACVLVSLCPGTSRHCGRGPAGCEPSWVAQNLVGKASVADPPLPALPFS